MQNLLDWVASKTVWILLIPALIVFGFTVAVPVYLSYQSGDWKLGYDINGAIGDFFGGIMNPFIALMALVWLVKGVTLQQQELRETKDALQASEQHQAKQVRIAAITALIQVELFKAESLRNNFLAINTAIQKHDAERPVPTVDQMMRDAVTGRKSFWEQKLDELKAARNDHISQLAAVKEKIAAYGLELEKVRDTA